MVARPEAWGMSGPGPSRWKRAAVVILSGVAGVGYLLAVVIVIAAVLIGVILFELARQQGSDSNRKRACRGFSKICPNS